MGRHARCRWTGPGVALGRFRTVSMSNIAQDGKGYSSGTQLAEGSYFGRRVGRHAARTWLAVYCVL